MRLLLDTNAYSALGRGHGATADLLRRAEEVLFSTVVLGEVLAGFRYGTRYQDNLDRLRRFLAQPRVRLVPVTWATADRYSRVFIALRRKGRPVPTNDMWVAAHALETGADLLSFDAHFGAIEGLAWVNPEW